jgi:hypothetical protein
LSHSVCLILQFLNLVSFVIYFMIYVGKCCMCILKLLWQCSFNVH